MSVQNDLQSLPSLLDCHLEKFDRCKDADTSVQRTGLDDGNRKSALTRLLPAKLTTIESLVESDKYGLRPDKVNSATNAVELDNSLLRSKLKQTHEENSDLIRQNHELIGNLEKLSWELSKAQGRIQKLNLEGKQLSNGVNVATYNDKIAELESQIVKLNNEMELDAVHWQKKLQQQQFAKSQSDDAAVALGSELRELRNKFEQSRKEISLLESQIAVAGEDQVELVQMKTYVSRLKGQEQQMLGDQQRLENKIADLTNTVHLYRSQLEEADRRSCELKHEIGRLGSSSSTERVHQTELLGRIHALEAKCNSLNNDLSVERSNVQQMKVNVDHEISKRVAVEKEVETQRCFGAYKDKYDNEINDLKSTINSLKDKNKQWKAKVVQLEKQLEESKLSQQCHLDSMKEVDELKNNQLRELERDLQVKNTLENDARKQRHLVQQKERDLHQATLSMRKSEQLLSDAERRMSLLEQQLSDERSDVANKKTEMSNLEQTCRNLEKRLTEYEYSCMSLEQKNSALQMENKKLNTDFATEKNRCRTACQELDTANSIRESMLQELDERANIGTCRILELESELNTCQKDIQHLQTNQEQSQQKWLASSKKCELLEVALKECQSVLRKSENARSKVENELKICKRKYSHMESERSRLQEELGELEVNLAAEKSCKRQLEQSLQAAQMQLQKSNSSLSSLQASIVQYETDFQKLRERYTIMENNLLATKENLNKANRDSNEQGHQLKLCKEESDSNRMCVHRLEEKLAMCESDRDTWKGQVDKLEKTKRELERQLQNIENLHSNSCTELIHARHNHDTLQMDLVRVKNQLKDKEEEFKHVCQQLDEKKSEIMSINNELSDFKSELMKRTEEVHSLESTLQNDHASLSQELASNQVELQQVKSKLKDTVQKKVLLDKTAKERAALILEAETKLKSLNSEVEKFKVRVKQLSKENQASEQELEQKDSDLQKLAKVVEQMVKERQRLLDEIACLKVETVQATSKGSAEKRQLSQIIEQLRQEHQTELERMQDLQVSKLTASENVNVELHSKLSDVTQQMEIMKSENTKLEKKIVKMEEEEKYLHDALREAQENITVRNSSVARLEAKLNSNNRSVSNSASGNRSVLLDSLLLESPTGDVPVTDHLADFDNLDSLQDQSLRFLLTKMNSRARQSSFRNYEMSQLV